MHRIILLLSDEVAGKLLSIAGPLSLEQMVREMIDMYLEDFLEDFPED